MERGVERDHRLPAGGQARDLDRVLDGLGARVEEGCARRAGEGSKLSEPLRKLDVPGIGNDGEIGVDEPRCLLLDRLDDVGVAVTDVANADAARRSR